MRPLVLLVALLVTTVPWSGGTTAPAAFEGPVVAGASAPTSAELRERRATVAALEVLHRWDGRRARAWARGEPSLLRPLYTAGSVAGRRDLALLRRYAERGWSVRGLRPQVLAAEALLVTHDRVRVRVHERSRARAVDAHGAPRVTGGDRSGRADRRERVVTLTWSRSGWRVDRVAAR